MRDQWNDVNDRSVDLTVTAAHCNSLSHRAAPFIDLITFAKFPDTHVDGEVVPKCWNPLVQSFQSAHLHTLKWHIA